MKKLRKPLSPKQKANLLTGQLLFRCACTSELIKLLREYGYNHRANVLTQLLELGRDIAYTAGKKAIEEANKDV